MIVYEGCVSNISCTFSFFLDRFVFLFTIQIGMVHYGEIIREDQGIGDSLQIISQPIQFQLMWIPDRLTFQLNVKMPENCHRVGALLMQ